jgi:exopolysaccharide biosynthesis polyprenyl glycosylphosphotransferase
MVIFILKIEEFSRLFYAIYAGIVLIAFIIEWALLELYLEKRQKTNFNARQVLLIGSDERIMAAYQALEKHRSWGHQVLGCLKINDQEGGYIPELPVIGNISDLGRILVEKNIDEVVFALPSGNPTNLQKYLNICEEMGVQFRIIPAMYKPGSHRIKVESILDIPTISFSASSISVSGLFYKRILDMVGGLVGFLFFLLLYPIIGLAIKIDSKGPVLFKQKRVGQHGRLFWLYKFRSMYVDAEEHKKELINFNEMEGLMFKMENDPRTTRIGRILRKTSLDEFPQFINVMKGEMSLVGTRPPTSDEVAQYEKWQRRRISMKPGITGLWQILGRNKIIDFNEVVRLDLEYIDKWRFLLDINILWKTILVVLARKGAK